MIGSLVPIQDDIQDQSPLRVFAGNGVTLYAEAGSTGEQHAHDILHAAEHVVAFLRQMLSPEEARTAPALEIAVAAEAAGAPLAHADLPLDAVHLTPEVIQSGDLLARELTHHLVQVWFGRSAANAPVVVHGIAGVAAARSLLRPAIEVSDLAVRDAMSAGRRIPLAGRVREARAEEQELVAHAETSFVAYLLAGYGAKALRKYLRSYNPDRTDAAARAAYHRPLPVLEEEWLARLRRRAYEPHALSAFLKKVMPLLRPYRWKQIEILVYLLLAAGYNVVQPYAIKTVIDRLTSYKHRGPDMAGPAFVHTLAPFLLLLAGIYVLNGLVSLRRAYTVSWLNQNVLNTLQVQMYAHLQRLSHAFYVRAKVGDLMSRINGDLDNVQSALSQITNKALYQSFTVIGALTALVMLTRKSPTLAIPILFIVPLFAVNYMALRSRNKQASRDQRERTSQAMVSVQQNLSAHALIKAFGLEDRTISEYRARVKSLQRSKLRLALLNALTDLSEDMTVALAQLIIFAVGGYLVLRDGKNALGVGDLSALLVLVKSIFSPIASLSGIGQTMQQATGAMERVSEILEEPVQVADRPGARPLPPLRGEIRLDHVSFSYGGERQALRDVSLTIPAGRSVALVGLSGAGKSSTVQLLLRFWDPEKGRVLFDGHDIRGVTLKSLRDQVALVFQETFIFNTTLRDNIAVGRPDATDAEIAAAAAAAQLDTFIESLPAGYDTIPGENGARLSVGQKQRIAIARAFLRNPRVLILDEATSALDAQTEAGVLDTLADLARGRTTISVTHRISQAAAADLIFVLEDGRVVEQGSHEELLRAGGVYQGLYENATGFIEHASPARVAA